MNSLVSPNSVAADVRRRRVTLFLRGICLLTSAATLRSFAIILVTLLFVAGCRPPGKPTEADIELKPEEVRDFAVLYKLNCAGCHGEDGKGNSALALANPIYLAVAD